MVFKVAVIAFFACVPLWLSNPYYLHVLIMTGIFTVGAMSLNLLLGYTGQLSLGHVAFFGVGAYTTALISLGFDVHITKSYVLSVQPMPIWFAFFCGILAAAICGWFIGKLSFKVRGAYFVIVSLSFAELLRFISVNWVDLTNGPMALNGISAMPFEVPWMDFGNLRQRVASYYLVLIFAVISYFVIERLVYSRFGRAMNALRENEPLALSIGVHVTRVLLVAAIISAAIAGAAGGLYAQYVGVVDPDIFLFMYTVTMVIMVIAGGKGTLTGPLVGGLIFGIVPEVLRSYAKPEVQWIIYGATMILIVYFLPQGIVPAVQGRFRSRGEQAGAVATEELAQAKIKRSVGQ